MAQERAPVGEAELIAKEPQAAGCVSACKSEGRLTKASGPVTDVVERMEAEIAADQRKRTP